MANTDYTALISGGLPSTLRSLSICESYDEIFPDEISPEAMPTAMNSIRLLGRALYKASRSLEHLAVGGTVVSDFLCCLHTTDPYGIDKWKEA